MKRGTNLPIAELERVLAARSNLQRELSSLWSASRELPNVAAREVTDQVDEVKSYASLTKLTREFPWPSVAAAGTIGYLAGALVREITRTKSISPTQLLLGPMARDGMGIVLSFAKEYLTSALMSSLESPRGTSSAEPKAQRSMNDQPTGTNGAAV